MVYVAAGWAFVVTLLLLASETGNRLPFIISLLLLLIMLLLRTYLHLKEEVHPEAILDVVLSIFLSAVSVVFLGNMLMMAHFYVDTWADFLNPQVIIYVVLNMVLLVPFVIFSLASLFRSLRDLRRNW